MHERNNNFILQKSSTYRVGVNEKQIKIPGQDLCTQFNRVILYLGFRAS